MPRVTRSQTKNAQNQKNTPKKIKKPLKSTKPRRQRNPKANIPDDLFGTEVVPLNSHCRQLFTGYYLNESKGKFDQIYVDTKNQAFAAPETSFLNFQRLFLLNRQFKRDVSTYFRYLHYHFSITSRPFNPSEFSGSNQLYFKSLDTSPQPPLDKHKSVAIFRNGALLHVFKENKFFELKKQGLFRPTATSLTFDGSDTTKIPIKFNLFSDLKSLRFHASEDLSGAFQRLLNESFVSLKELAFYHPKFVSKITTQTAFPPNLQVLCSSATPSTILDFNVNLYKQLLLVETSRLEVGIELLIRLSKLSDDQILLNSKIQELTIQWTHWPDDIAVITSRLLVNAPFLKVIRFRERILQILHAPRCGFGKRRNFTPKSSSFSCFGNGYFADIMLNLQEAVENNGRPLPFRTIYEQGLFFLDGRQKQEDQLSCMTYPIDVQIVFQPPRDTQIQLLENGKLVGSPVEFVLNDPEKDVQTAMCKLWTDFCEFNKLGQPDVNNGT